MDDYISREWLIARLGRNLAACNPGTFSEGCYTDAIETVRNAPAADVEPVVRCRECKYFESASGYCNFHSQYYDGGGTWEIFKADDFCSCGERKEDTP